MDKLNSQGRELGGNDSDILDEINSAETRSGSRLDLKPSPTNTNLDMSTTDSSSITTLLPSNNGKNNPAPPSSFTASSNPTSPLSSPSNIPLTSSSFKPLSSQLGGHANIITTNGPLLIKRSNPREIAFYIYLRSLSRELSLEARERAENEKGDFGKGFKGVIDIAGTLVGQVWSGGEKAGRGVGEMMGNLGGGVGRSMSLLAGRTGSRIRALTLPSGSTTTTTGEVQDEKTMMKTSESYPDKIPSNSSSTPTSAMVMPDSASTPTTQTTNNRLSSLFSRLPKFPATLLLSSLGSQQDVPSGTAGPGDEQDELNSDIKIGLDPTDDLAQNENAARKNVSEILMIDHEDIPTSPIKGSGSGFGSGIGHGRYGSLSQDGFSEREEERNRAERLLRDMKGIKMSNKGKGKERSGSGSGSGSRTMSVSSSTGSGYSGSALGGGLVEKGKSLSVEEGEEAEDEERDTGATYHGHSLLPPRTSSSENINPSLPTSDPLNISGLDSHNHDPVDQLALLAQLMPFLPKFYGTMTMEDEEGVDQKVKSAEGVEEGSEESLSPGPVSKEAIIIENLLSPFTNPSALDVKLGTVLYDETDSELSEKKKEKMRKKAEGTTSGTSGLKFSAFQTWDDSTQTLIKIPRTYGSSLEISQLPEAIGKFFPAGPTSSTSTVSTDRHRTNILRILSSLVTSLESYRTIIAQLDIRLIGTSLFIVYEGNSMALDQAWKAADQGTAPKNGLRIEKDEVEEESQPSSPIGKVTPLGGKRSKPTSASTTISKAAQSLVNRKSVELDQAVEDRLTEDAAEFEIETASASSLIEQEEEGYSEGEAAREDGDDYGSDVSTPWQIRVIDFAHTRLAPGEGPDEGYLKGLDTMIGLVKGRIGELKQI